MREMKGRKAEMGKEIVISTAFNAETQDGTVRVSPAAMRVVTRLRDLTGHSARHIVSEIIIQSEKLIRIEHVKLDGNGGE